MASSSQFGRWETCYVMGEADEEWGKEEAGREGAGAEDGLGTSDNCWLYPDYRLPIACSKTSFVWEVKWKSLSRVWLFVTPMDYTHSLWNSPGQNTGVGGLSLFQGIFSTQRSNPGLLHCRQILYQLSHEASPLHKSQLCIFKTFM